MFKTSKLFKQIREISVDLWNQRFEKT